jgi:hypothetical protein
VPGHLRLDELDSATELHLTSSDEYSTLSGLILEHLGRTAVVGDEARIEARREVVPERHLHPAEGHPDADADTPAGDLLESDHADRHDRADRHDPERRHLPVSVRLTVEAVERHVPSSVRVEVLDLLSDLEALEGDAPGRATDEGTGASR